jgi:hypothetical protein
MGDTETAEECEQLLIKQGYAQMGFAPGTGCNATFDTVLCWPPLLPGANASLSCPNKYAMDTTSKQRSVFARCANALQRRSFADAISPACGRLDQANQTLRAMDTRRTRTCVYDSPAAYVHGCGPTHLPICSRPHSKSHIRCAGSSLSDSAHR